MNRLLLSGVILLLAGCTVGPDFERPAPPAQSFYDLATLPAEERVTETGPRLQTGSLPAEWWRLLKSPSLDQTEQLGLAGNKTLIAAKATLRQAEQAIIEAQSAFWPQVSLSGGVQRNGSGGFTPQGGGTSSNFFSLGPTLSYTADLFGATARTVEGSRAQADYQRMELAAAELTLTGGIAAEAIAIAGARLQITSAEEILASDQRNFALVQRQFAVGKAARADMLTAQSQMVGDQSQLAQWRQQLSVARHALAVLVSRFPSDWAPPDFTMADFSLPPDLPVSLPSELVRHRPDILAAEAQLHSASAAIGVAQANFYPTLTLSAAVTQQSIAPAKIFNSINNLWSLGANLGQTITSGGMLDAQKQAAIEGFQAQLAIYEQTVVVALGQVADSLRALEHDAEQVTAAQAALDIASQSLALQRASYAVGKTSLLQLLTAERTFAQARQSLASGQVQQLQDVVQFFLAMGG